MSNFYIVRAVPLRDNRGMVLGWVRVDVFADGTRPSDVVFLRDGAACGQAEAISRITTNPALMYPTRAEAVRDGLDRLRDASTSGGSTLGQRG